ncbi:hypothetical protein [Hydrogenophaga sp. OTU3427]|uniref:hypothetical protein n=1 Tax=Hydrogenophaga sp. OTU3427 TaxID=3043856 RepID=UPI00313E72DB
MALIINIQASVDLFWSGVWWIGLRRWWQERRLAAVLEKNGELSLVTRRVTEQYRILQRNIRFWRVSPPLILDVLEACHDAGVPIHDLQLLALNKDIKLIDGIIKVRTSFSHDVLAYLAVSVAWASWAMPLSLIAASPLPWFWKLIGLTATTLLFWVLWRGWALYTTLGNAAIKRSGSVVEEVAMQVRRSSPIAQMTYVDDRLVARDPMSRD